MDSLAFLDASKLSVRPVYALTGDEDFLKRQVMLKLRPLVLGEGDDGMARSSYEGDKALLADVLDELQTLPFLSPRRLVVIENADPFVSKYRAQLEKYLTQPAARGVLVLTVKAWAATTRLAKQLDDASTIVCKAITTQRLPDWCVRWAASHHAKQLAAPAARLLVDLVGGDMGLLDQELAKLSIYVGDQPQIETNHVDLLVGNSRMENTWKIFDAIGAGQSGEALTILDRLFDQGDDPIRTLGAFSLQLRRLAQAYRLNRLGKPLSTALIEAGFPPFAVRGGEQQMRHLGQRRAERLYDWLLETDLGLKGSSQLPARTQLERLVVRLAAARPNG